MGSCKDTFVLLLFLYTAASPVIPVQACYHGTGRSYRGTLAHTVTGKTCQAWSSMAPHHHTKTPSAFPNADLRRNYCRNPDYDDNGPWCYTTDPSTRWEYCNLRQCQEWRSKVSRRECKRGYGQNYRGTQSKTQNGVTCQGWADRSPHVPNYSPSTHPNAALEENYCRNPDNDARGPWCYTTDSGTRFDYCNIPECAAFLLECKRGNGQDYRGTVSKTQNGVTCQRWAVRSPHVPNYSPSTHPNAFLEENYCRNPDNDARGPWCYTRDPRIRYDYCNIPGC